MNILIADDNPTNLKLLRLTLVAEGHRVFTACDGVEALETLDRERIDAVISDILMPRMDGYRFCYEVRRNERFHALPFIFYTNTYLSTADEKLALDLGADKFLRKPATAQELAASLREVTSLAKHRQPVTKLSGLDVLKQYSERLVSKLEQKNIELEFAHQELRHLLGHSPAVLYTVKLSGRKANPVVLSGNFERLLGFQVEEPIRREWCLQLLHPNDRDRIGADMFGGLTRGDYSMEYRLRHKDGTYRWVEDNCHVIRDASGQPQGAVGVWTDVTERKHAEEALRASERRFREMLENVEMVALTLDSNGRITFCNDYFLRLTGKRREEVMGEDWFSLFIPETDEGHRRNFFDALKFGKTRAHIESTIKTKTGQIREIAWNNTTLRDASGNIVGVASLGEDITERRKHERLALRAQRLGAIGALASGLAHDLNNALAPIMMAVEVLKIEYPGHSQLLETIETSTKHSADMVRQLLTFAKGAEGERVSIQPSRLIKEMQNIITNTFPKNIELVVICDPNHSTVLGDATQLQQVLLNLCVNARDAMPNGGTLTLEAQRIQVDAAHASSIPDAKPGRYVVLRVRDTGTGIPLEIIDRIFEPFFTTKSQDKGTGLGLSTVLGVVKGHGGFLQVQSQPGQGSTFTAYLPVERGSSNTELAIKAGIRFRGKGETILLVDDEPGVREMARVVLRHLNLKPLTATDGADGLIKAAENRTELSAVIADLAMPHMDGLAFIRALRQMLPDIPIVVSSGRVDDPVAGEFRALGVTNRLDKPFTEGQLAEALKSLLELK